MMNEPSIPARHGDSQPQTEQPSASSSSSITSPGATPQNQELEPSPHSKPCFLCHRRRDVLIRCQIDETQKWHFVCTGKCWQQVSGGTTDGDAEHRDYKYGGMWKNKHEYVSAKIKGKAKDENKNYWNGTPGPHRRPAAKEKLFKRRKDLGRSHDAGQGKGGVVIGSEVDDGEGDVSEFSDEEDYVEYEEPRDGLSHVQVKHVDE